MKTENEYKKICLIKSTCGYYKILILNVSSRINRVTSKSTMHCHARESGNPEDVDFLNSGFPIK
ncbi:MAG: hypothetical protein ACREIQ_12375, partial [Nitrospiria bacterium]